MDGGLHLHSWLVCAICVCVVRARANVCMMIVLLGQGCVLKIGYLCAHDLSSNL